MSIVPNVPNGSESINFDNLGNQIDRGGDHIGEVLDELANELNNRANQAEKLVTAGEQYVEANIERLNEIDDKLSEVSFLVGSVEPLLKDIHKAFKDGIKSEGNTPEKLSNITKNLNKLSALYEQKANDIDGEKMPTAKKFMETGSKVIGSSVNKL